MDQVAVREIDGLRLVLTCSACPEQYDVFDGDTQVGYLRLRHGRFRVDYYLEDHPQVYVAHPAGDGIFDDEEREFFLTEAVKALKEQMRLTAIKSLLTPLEILQADYLAKQLYDCFMDRVEAANPGVPNLARRWDDLSEHRGGDLATKKLYIEAALTAMSKWKKAL